MIKASKKHEWKYLGTRKRFCAKRGAVINDYGWYSQEFLHRDGKWRKIPPKCKPIKYKSKMSLK